MEETIVGQSVFNLTDHDSSLKKSFRGKVLQWEAFIDPKTQDFEYYSDYDSDVIRDAAALSYAKFSTREHRCKAMNCSYKRKYFIEKGSARFLSYFCGNHNHDNDGKNLISHRGYNALKSLGS